MRPGSYVSCMQCDADLTKKGVKRRRCAGCHSVFYDDVTCQKKDWAIHKTECKELQRRFIAAVRSHYPEVDTMAKLLARPDACKIIALRYFLGEGGFERNAGLTVFWATQWTKGGDVDALTTLASLYLHGGTGRRTGVPVDTDKGRKLLQKGVDQGHAITQCMLGAHSMFGLGVDQDPDEGRRLLRLAADQGFELAKKFLNFANMLTLEEMRNPEIRQMLQSMLTSGLNNPELLNQISQMSLSMAGDAVRQAYASTTESRP